MKRTVFTTISPLPGGISREVVVDFLHNHVEMIDLNPLVKERHPIKPPPKAPDDEMNCIWYSLTDRITYLPGGLASGDVSYTCAFHDLPNGIQTHCRAPLSVDIRDKWTLNGTLPGEAPEPVELGIGAPATGLYIREDVDLRCNVLMASFVKKNLTRAHATLVERLVERAKLIAFEEESICSAKSPCSAVQEHPQRPWTPFQTSEFRATDGSTRLRAAQGPMSPPPQLGSPLLAAHRYGRGSSPSHRSLHEYGGDPAHTRTHHQSHSPDSFKIRMEAYRDPSFPTPPTVQPGRQFQHHPPPPAAYHDSVLYPQPLRLRKPSLGSGGQAEPHMSGATGGHAISSQASIFSSNTRAANGRPSTSESRASSDDSWYPQLNPYSGEGSSPDEPLPPSTPQFIAELPSHDVPKEVDAPGVSETGHPEMLMLAGVGMSARLDTPFVAGLE